MDDVILVASNVIKIYLFMAKQGKLFKNIVRMCMNNVEHLPATKRTSDQIPAHIS